MGQTIKNAFILGFKSFYSLWNKFFFTSIVYFGLPWWLKG